MRRSELKQRPIIIASGNNLVQKEPYRLVRSSSRVRLGRPRPIWYKESSYSRWPFIVVFVVLCLLVLAAFAQASPPQSRGARPLALGNGYTAVSGDAYSLFYNPAGLYDIGQKEFALDYGRAYGVREAALSDFNGIYAMPYRYKDKPFPLAAGIFAEAPASGAHIVDLSAGAATDAPLDRWTKGILKFPARMGLAVTLRHQTGEKKTTRVGKSSLGLGLTGGFLVPINRQHQLGIALKRLFLGDSDPDGPSLQVGIQRHHRDFLDMFADLEYSNGGVWRFHPGLEWSFSRGVLRPRLGWGFRDTGQVDHVATGIGFYLSPMQIDITYLIPVKTVNDNAGQFRASLLYRFGRPQFSEIYYDRALEAASQLDQKVLNLTTKEAEMKASLAEVEQKRRLAAEELGNIKKRIEILKEQDLLGERDATIKQMRARIKELEGALNYQRSETNALRQKKAEVRTHTVAPGDTLQSIAREYYGDPNQWKKIYTANPDKIDRGLPKTGAKLVIP